MFEETRVTEGSRTRSGSRSRSRVRFRLVRRRRGSRRARDLVRAAVLVAAGRFGWRTKRAGARSPSGRQSLATNPVPLPFVALPPCRLVDTRAPLYPAPLGGGFLPSATVRSYTLTGVCNVPASAQAISLNATVVNPVGAGFLTLWPQDGPFPPVSTLNFRGNDVVVNAAVVPLSASGGISIALGVSGGDVVSGYERLLLAAGSREQPEREDGRPDVRGGQQRHDHARNRHAVDQRHMPGSSGSDRPDGSRWSPGRHRSEGRHGSHGRERRRGASRPGGRGGTCRPQRRHRCKRHQLVARLRPVSSSSQDTSGCPQTGGLPVDSNGAVIWANDTFTRTYIVKPNSDGTFDVTELFDGTFVTLNSSTPVGTVSNCSTLLNAGITGQFYGDYAIKTPVGLNFNFKGACPAGCTGSQFFLTFFGTTLPNSYAWQFHYTTPSNGSWDNTDHGNSGDLHN